MILRDYICSKCQHTFEAWDEDDPVCPACGYNKLEQTWTKPPGYKSIKTSNADNIIKDLASAHGLTDYNQNPSTLHTYTGPPIDPAMKHAGIGTSAGAGKISVDLNSRQMQMKSDNLAQTLKGIIGGTSGIQYYNGLQEAPRLPDPRTQTLYLQPDGTYRKKLLP